MGIKDQLNAAMCALKSVWYDFIDTLVTGDCGCHYAVILTFKSVKKTTCNPQETNLAIFNVDNCTVTEDIVRETINMPVFFSHTKFPSGISIYIPAGHIKIITNEANMKKLQKAEKIEVQNEFYEKASPQTPMGFDETYTFYMIEFKKCLE